MPLYEYECRKCGNKFSIVLRMSELAKESHVRCPRCSSVKVQKCIEPFFAVTPRKS